MMRKQNRAFLGFIQSILFQNDTELFHSAGNGIASLSARPDSRASFLAESRIRSTGMGVSDVMKKKRSNPGASSSSYE
jgi:hypothetical protein